jgi:hypothetical protein
MEKYKKEYCFVIPESDCIAVNIKNKISKKQMKL